MINAARRSLFKGKLSQVKPANRLPWVKSEQHFIADCTQCQQCVTACPENIIIRGDGGYPEIDFSRGECTFCQRCVDSCPQPLFVATKTEAAWRADVAIANTCLAANAVMCQSCRDVCDSRAITFSYQSGAIARPKINSEHCNGCGACVSICPQQSISVQTHSQLEPA